MSSDSGEDWNDWTSDEEESDFAVPTPDLFTANLVHPSPKAFLAATLAAYNFDLKQFLLDNELNTYRRIRCCNYLRKLCRDTYKSTYTASTTDIARDLLANIDQWKDDEALLIPVLSDDGLVQFAATANHGFDSDDDQYWEDEDEDCDEDGEEEAAGEAETDEDEGKQQMLINKQQSVKIKMLQRQVDQLAELLQSARSKFAEYAFSDDSFTSTTPQSALGSATTPASPEQSTQASAQAQSTAPAAAGGQPKPKFGPDDEGYFQSYSGRNIHEEMLADKHRTESYQNAIKQLGPLLKDKVVLDVGCGTGILSMFAAQYGAKLVIGVDAADIIDKTREIVKKNGFEGRIQLIKGKIEEVTLPVDTVDIIISEWMGYYLLFESMLPSVFYARNKWLRREATQLSILEEKKAQNALYQYDDARDNALSTQPFAATTRLLPDVARMFVAGATQKDYQDVNVTFWKDIYGFDMSEMIYDNHLFPGSVVYITPGKDVLTTNDMYAAFDLMACTDKDLSFTAQDIEIVADSDTIIDSFLVWFDTPFVGTQESIIGRDQATIRGLPIATPSTAPSDSTDIILTTSPFHPPTHWKQTLFRLRNIMKVQKGDKIKLTIQSTTRKDNHRTYDILLKYSFESKLVLGANEVPQLAKTQFAKAGDVYDQLFSLQ